MEAKTLLHIDMLKKVESLSKKNILIWTEWALVTLIKKWKPISWKNSRCSKKLKKKICANLFVKEPFQFHSTSMNASKITKGESFKTSTMNATVPISICLWTTRLLWLVSAKSKRQMGHAKNTGCLKTLGGKIGAKMDLCVCVERIKTPSNMGLV